jgi:recombination protein RecR
MSVLGQLMNALQILPGVGPKTAQRMTFYLMQKNREGAVKLAEILQQACERIRQCNRCRTLTENELCRICASSERDESLLCVVETPAELMQIEQATGFKGKYFVLHGRLSPLDGLGPAELGFHQLVDILSREPTRELIIATNATIEGETTARYLAQLAARAGIQTTRLAHGVPLGGELEYTDSMTLAHAFSHREPVE